jgi:hypothetical protein
MSARSPYCGGVAVDGLDVADRLRRKLGDEVDVGLLLDEPLGQPPGVHVALELEREGLARGDDGMARGGVLAAGHVLVLEAPGVGDQPARLHESRRGMGRLERAPRAGDRLVRDEPRDGIEPEDFEELVVGFAREVFVHVITHDVMRRHGQMIGGPAVEGGAEALFGCHGLHGKICGVISGNFMAAAAARD